MSTYHILIAIGCAVGFVVARTLPMPKEARRMSLGFFLSAVAGIVIGAKLPLIISYGLQPEFLYTGKSFLGGVVGAFVSINVYKAILGKSAASLGGRFVIPLAVAAGFGKIGCWFNDCCGSTAGFPIPAQLLESAFQFLAAGSLAIFYSQSRRLDLLFPIYFVAYLSMRFGIEFIRTEPTFWLGLTLYQWIALTFLPIGVWILYRRSRN